MRKAWMRLQPRKQSWGCSKWSSTKTTRTSRSSSKPRLRIQLDEPGASRFINSPFFTHLHFTQMPLNEYWILFGATFLFYLLLGASYSMPLPCKAFTFVPAFERKPDQIAVYSATCKTPIRFELDVSSIPVIYSIRKTADYTL